MSDPLHLFHPLISEWFQTRYGQPTDVQQRAWPVIASGQHALITAPTGSGKTLTAFLWAINQLVTGSWPSKCCSVLYISPLKALNNDIQRNLLTPLEELEALFIQRGLPFPAIQITTRSGDTSAQARRSMERRPPEILITTPESLNLMISSRAGQRLFPSLRTVILDEIHAVVGGKRGVHLMAAVERLVQLSGEFQRIALSATVRPMEMVSQYVGGYQLVERGTFRARPVVRVHSPATKRYDVRVHIPPRPDNPQQGSVWDAIVQVVHETVLRNRSTLVFTNNRRLAETITWKLNARSTDMLAYAHHGSLSREIRHEVERKMKAGRLKAIVATSSLEMGIDIGDMDVVVLIQSPQSIASAIQRIGRAGHRVGDVSRALMLPTHSMDILDCAVLVRAILDQDIEETRAVICPLDVLALQIVAMTGTETWDVEALYDQIRCSYPFQSLSRRHFELVLQMLAGRYAETRIRELTARISWDMIDNTVSARPGALQALYMGGGVIPDRGYYHLRHADGGMIGELDEEFVWEARVGQQFTFGTQDWRIERITHNDVFVKPAGGGGKAAPFWRSEEYIRDAHFADRVAGFLEMVEPLVDTPALVAKLEDELGLSRDAADQLIEFLRRQRAACRTALPHRRHIVVEEVQAGLESHPGRQIVIHTFWGGQVNKPYALALSAAWQERHGDPLEIHASNEALYILTTSDISPEELLSLVPPERVHELLRQRLEGSGLFGARFRECAGRALLISRNKRGERLPLWISRLRSKRLHQAVRKYGDFPITLEAWRSCLQDDFDIERLIERLDALRSGEITWSACRTDSPSPFAQSNSWRQINQYMYQDDTPDSHAEGASVRPDLLQEVVFTAELRPAIPRSVAQTFEQKLQRTAEGYSPQSPRDLLDWLKERVVIPDQEWRALMDAIEQDQKGATDEWLCALHGKMVMLRPLHAQACMPLHMARESMRHWGPVWAHTHVCDDGESITSLPAPAGELTAEELRSALVEQCCRFYSIFTDKRLSGILQIPVEHVRVILDDLVDQQVLITGHLTEQAEETEWCDARHFESLLRLTRQRSRPVCKTQPIVRLPLFLARHQGLCPAGETRDDLSDRLARLSGYVTKADMWEQAILPARMQSYDQAWLDGLLQEGSFCWIGHGTGRITFALSDDVQTLPAAGSIDARWDDLLPDSMVRYPLSALSARTRLPLPQLMARLWDGVWSGRVTNDSMATLRQGILTGFTPPEVPVQDPRSSWSRRSGRRPSARGSMNRWAASIPYSGCWYRLPDRTPENDLLEQEERAKERARIVLDRYGVVFRELLHAEIPELQWPAVFRALRLMELAGEVLTGHFFNHVPGLQFASHEAFRALGNELTEDRVWWLNACDPASCCGVAISELRTTMPRRVPGNWMVYRGNIRIADIARGGRDLWFYEQPDNPDAGDALRPLIHILYGGQPQSQRIPVDTINDAPSPGSPWLALLRSAFDVAVEPDRVTLWALHP